MHGVADGDHVEVKVQTQCFGDRLFPGDALTSSVCVTEILCRGTVSAAPTATPVSTPSISVKVMVEPLDRMRDASSVQAL